LASGRSVPRGVLGEPPNLGSFRFVADLVLFVAGTADHRSTMRVVSRVAAAITLARALTLRPTTSSFIEVRCANAHQPCMGIEVALCSPLSATLTRGASRTASFVCWRAVFTPRAAPLIPFSISSAGTRLSSAPSRRRPVAIACRDNTTEVLALASTLPHVAEGSRDENRKAS
jgi:hypothetical protein